MPWAWATKRMSGDTGFAYVNGSDAYLVNFVQINDFANKDERSWQARYDYNFAALGIPGLTFMTRYLVRRQHRSGRRQARRPRMGARHRHRLRGAERSAEKRRPEVA